MSRNTHKTEAFFLIAILIVIGVVVSAVDFPGGSFVKYEELQILSLISSLFVVAVFMERSVEAILKPVRGPDKQKLLYEIQKNEAQIEEIKERQKDLDKKIQIIDTLLVAPKDSDQGVTIDINKAQADRDYSIGQKSNNHTEITALKKDALKKSDTLQQYRLVTMKYAMWISFVFGLIISVVGVRILQNIIKFECVRKGLQPWLFNSTDIILTGCVIAGGSAAIDKIGRVISSNLKMQ